MNTQLAMALDAPPLAPALAPVATVSDDIAAFRTGDRTWRCWTVRTGPLPGATHVEWRSDDRRCVAWRSGFARVPDTRGGPCATVAEGRYAATCDGEPVCSGVYSLLTAMETADAAARRTPR